MDWKTWSLGGEYVKDCDMLALHQVVASRDRCLGIRSPYRLILH